MKQHKRQTKNKKEIVVYDDQDASSFIDKSKPIKLADLGLKLPATPPTQVISIRLSSELLNDIRALGSQQDVPYQALIKIFLAESVAERKKKSA